MSLMAFLFWMKATHHSCQDSCQGLPAQSASVAGFRPALCNRGRPGIALCTASGRPFRRQATRYHGIRRSQMARQLHKMEAQPPQAHD